MAAVCMSSYVIAWLVLPEMSVGFALYLAFLGQLVR